MKELQAIEIISDYLYRKKIIEKIDSINKIYNFFMYLQNNRFKFNTLYIYNYLYSFISSNEVAKRKTNSRILEDLLATIFKAEVADFKQRKNLDYEVNDYFVNVKDKIASNRREKADIIFFNKYCLSIKTLIEKNTEINMGSFEKRVLFDSLKVDNFLSERKSIDGAGIGSKPQFLKLLKIIDTLSGYDNFRNKFNKMVEFIYADDLLLVIKNNMKMKLYFFSGNEIINIFQKFSQSKENFLKIVNRYEGNSLRIDRNILIQECKKTIFIDFSYLKSKVISLINNFDYKLHIGYVKYFEGNKDIKKTIFKDLEKMFFDFDKDYEEAREGN